MIPTQFSRSLAIPKTGFSTSVGAISEVAHLHKKMIVKPVARRLPAPVAPASAPALAPAPVAPTPVAPTPPTPDLVLVQQHVPEIKTKKIINVPVTNLDHVLVQPKKVTDSEDPPKHQFSKLISVLGKAK